VNYAITMITVMLLQTPAINLVQIGFREQDNESAGSGCDRALHNANEVR
jgi:hypothetical protein